MLAELLESKAVVSMRTREKGSINVAKWGLDQEPWNSGSDEIKAPKW